MYRYYRVVILLTLVATPLAWAESEQKFWVKGNTRVAGAYHFYNGSVGSSLTGARGYGISVSGEKPNQLFSITSGLNFDFASGRAKFNDGGSVRSSSFSLLSASVFVGLKLFVIPVASSPLRPFVGASGIFGVGDLQLGSSSLSSLQKTYVASQAGYYLSAGLDVIFSAPTQGKAGSILFFETQMSNVRGAMAGNSAFSTASFKLILGVGW